MDLLKHLTACLIVSFITIGISRARTIRETHSSNFVGEGTSELATALLQGFVNEERNFVFSPLGYSTILAILAEGARGNSRNELVNILRLPEDTYAVRNTFKNILETMKERWTLNRPEFHNWFYVYNNTTVDDAYKDVLLENYLTKVQTVERVHIEINFDENSGTEISDNEKDKQQEKASENSKEELKGNEKNYTFIVTENTSIEAEEEIKSDQKEDKNNKGETGEETKDSEKPEEEKQDQSTGQKIQINKKHKQEETIQNQSEEATVSQKYIHAENQNDEKPQIDIKTEKENIGNDVNKNMEKSEVSNRKSDRSLDPDKDVMSTLTANRIITRESCKSGINKKSKMIIFNGLYFRGSWKTPFCVSKTAEDTSFYVTNTEKKTVEAMHARGKFNMGLIPELDCAAIELPYEGDKYSLLLLVPNARDGLPKLISDLTGYSLSQVYKHLLEKQMQVTIPKFHFQTISHPVDALKKYGLTEIFSTNADLSGISSKESLVLGDLVQLVTVYVEEGSSETNYLTATNAESTRSTFSDSLTALDVTWFKANHPFLFFIRDQTNNVILAAGKVLDPTVPSDELKGKTINN